MVVLDIDSLPDLGKDKLSQSITETSPRFPMKTGRGFIGLLSPNSAFFEAPRRLKGEIGQYPVTAGTFERH